MEPMKSKINRMFSSTNKASVGGQQVPNIGEWEIRPGGMLVQKRNSDTNPSNVSVPTIRVRVKYGSVYHEVYISSQASFGELKKKLAEPTGLHPLDQKLIFKNKERDSKSYLDVVKVKDGSKMVLVENITSRERRCVEMMRISAVEKACKSLANIILDVEKHEKQVKELEETASRGGKIAKTEIENLIENLMTKLIQLDGIVAEGDLKQQRKIQVRRVQKCIETLDFLKLQSSKSSSIADKTHIQQQDNSIMHKSKPVQKIQVPQKRRNFTAQKIVLQNPLQQSESVVVTTKWETFD